MFCDSIRIFSTSLQINHFDIRVSASTGNKMLTKKTHLPVDPFVPSEGLVALALSFARRCGLSCTRTPGIPGNLAEARGSTVQSA